MCTIEKTKSDLLLEELDNASSGEEAGNILAEYFKEKTKQENKITVEYLNVIKDWTSPIRSIQEVVDSTSRIQPVTKDVNDLYGDIITGLIRARSEAVVRANDLINCFNNYIAEQSYSEGNVQLLKELEEFRKGLRLVREPIVV